MKNKTSKRGPVIVVGTNSLTESQYPAYTNHCQLWFRFGRNFPDAQFIFMNPARMSIDRMRNAAARIALEQETDYLLFLDDDVIIRQDHSQIHPLQKLINCNADIAAGKVIIRGYPFEYMVFKEMRRNGKKGLFTLNSMPEKGVIDVDAVGFSWCLIKTSVLKSMPEPWFVTGLNNTEDIYFCVKAKEANPKLKIRVECSTVCGHILWPEVIDPINVKNYKKYYESINPNVLEIVKQKRLDAKNPRGDRSSKYLQGVKDVIEVDG